MTQKGPIHVPSPIFGSPTNHANGLYGFAGAGHEEAPAPPAEPFTRPQPSVQFAGQLQMLDNRGKPFRESDGGLPAKDLTDPLC